jgi:hypothetical protein
MMEKLLKRVIILLLLFYGGRWGVERFVALVDARYEAREELARQVGEKKAGEIQRTIDDGNARRTEALQQQLGTNGNALQSVGTTPPINGAVVRRQLDEAQARRSEALTP